MPEPNQALLEHLLALEAALQTREVRSVEARLRELLAPDFREFGRSGAAYTLNDILGSLPAETGRDDDTLSISDFRISVLSEGVALATYLGTRTRPDGSRLLTNRSSIWREEADGQWRMVFHQGTPAI
ncbi:DUF4440 domain-containing protein [Neorhizobium lilium]|uniref:DUF4440 domain-containing protein n=1 Tax=Neorhizobium lilium TaxID=2503024 RepID=A0A444LJ40_9HYPH|nr:DUF4440 domain-containing protein [Neorhizobium lilium]RWX79051.1 DUF4440 domain-containing protein [Neorhizobium lilium]